MPFLNKTQIAEAANIAWDILVRVATNKESITYGDLVKEIRKKRDIQELVPLNVGRPLELIYLHCNSEKSAVTKEDLPPLTVLVVNAQDSQCAKDVRKDGEESECTKCGELVRRRGHPSIGYSKARKSIPEDSYAVYDHKHWEEEPKPNF